MKRMLMFPLVFAAWLPQFASANKIIGNGGIVLVCPGQIPPVQLLDVWEATKSYKFPGRPRLTLSVPQGRNYDEKFQTMVARIALRFPDLADQILKEYAELNLALDIAEKEDFGPTNDDFSKTTPEGCVKKQGAIQSDPMFVRTYLLSIKAEYWAMMDDFHRAALLLHESVYRIGIKNGLEHSVGVRYLVGLLLANELDQIGDDDWIGAFIQSRIPNFEVGRLKVPLFSGDFAPCEILPGRESCNSFESFKRASFRFNAAHRLQQVSYGSGEESVWFQTRDSVAASLKVSSLYFDWSRGFVELVGKGEMTVHQKGREVAMRFNGRVSAIDGLFSGTQVVMDAKQRDIMNREFSGSLAQIVADFGYDSTPNRYLVQDSATVDNSRTASTGEDVPAPVIGIGTR